jgi:hypothetical protein
MDIATTVAAIVLGAAAGESVNEFLFMPLIDALLTKMPNANKEIIKRAWSCAVGIAIALEYSLDAFSLLGMRAWHAWFGIVVTGALLGRGSNWLHEWIKGKILDNIQRQAEATMAVSTARASTKWAAK